MALALTRPDIPSAAPTVGTWKSALADDVGRAPLVPAALAATAGIVADRYVGIPLLMSLLVALTALAAWALAYVLRSARVPLACLAVAAAALGAGYHHAYRGLYRTNDIGNFAATEPRLACLRGVLEEEPITFRASATDPLRSFSSNDSTLTVLGVTRLKQRDDWLPVSGRVRLAVHGELRDLHAGDEVEVVGRLIAPTSPANPGEADPASQLLDQRIRAQVIVDKTPDGVTRLTEGWSGTASGWLAAVRGWGRRVLQKNVPEYGGLATALLLGDGSAMTSSEWEKYQRSGVVHVLAISGQHLAVLACVL